MEDNGDDDFLVYHIAYSFSSGLGEVVESACITMHEAIISADNLNDDSPQEYVGQLKFLVVHLAEAEEAGLDVFDLFDSHECSYRHGQSIYDFDEETFNNSVLQVFPDLELWCRKICIIESVGIVAKFRGRNIASQVFIDLERHYGHCELFVIEPFPLQFSNVRKDEAALLDLSQFVQDQNEARRKLCACYEKWGFKKIEGVEGLMLYSPLYRKEAMV